MVLSQDTKQLLKGLGIKLSLGLLGFIATFVADQIGQFNLNPILVAAIVALLDDVTKWANSRYDVAARVGRLARAVGIRR